jgi:putative hydrolase of the HAD superfamily
VGVLQAIVFDLDDTLYPESGYVRSGFAAVGAWASGHLSVSADAAAGELWSLFKQGVRGDTFDRWLTSRSLPETHVAAMVEAYREHQPTIAAFPEVPALLERLGHRHRLGLLSDGHADVQRRKLDALALAPHFASIVFSDDLGRDAWKPSPIPYRRVLAELGVDPADAVYVADNPAKDFAGARDAGMRSIRVRRPGGVHAAAEPAAPRFAPDAEIGSLGELEQALPSLAS